MISKAPRFLVSLLVLSQLLSFLLPYSAFPQTASQTALVLDQPKALTAIEEKLEARRKELGIPGLSLAIVKDDKVIFAKGLGYKDLEKKIPVTADTEFAIGSATKAFTALTVLMSQDDGKLSVDDSPKKYLPYFHMYDPDTDKNITIRDLLSHSSGLNRTDLAMITGKLNRAELIEVAAQAKPTAKLREKFQYQNIMFTAAGEIAATVQKQPYSKLVVDRIFKPLGMTNSTMSMKEMQKARDFSFGYSYNFDTKETQRLPFRDIDEVAPAGSINSSANDMSRWVRFVLDGGIANGKRLVSEKSYEEWLKPQMKIGGKSSYGFGWFLQDWNGMKVVQHGGNIDGFNSMVAMIPEKKIGFVLLTNVSASSLGNEMMDVIWQNLLGENDPVTDTTAEGSASVSDPAAARELVGKYIIAAANVTAEIGESQGKVTITIPGQPPYTLMEKSKDLYSLPPLPADFSLRPKRDAAGKIVSIIIAQPQGDAEFARRDESAGPGITVDEIMQKNTDAVGGEAAWRKITTRIIESDIDLENQGVKGTSVSYTKAPNKAASETTLTALGKIIAKGWEFFDGNMGEESYTFAPVEKFSGRRLDDARISADFYSQLNWKTNFKKAEVQGTAKIAGEDAYVVSFEPEKGTAFKEYYSTTTFLLLKREGFVPSSTSSLQLPYTITFSDYRDVDGIKLPFRTVNYSVSNGNIVTTVRSVKHNVALDDKLFTPRKMQ